MPRRPPRRLIWDKMKVSQLTWDVPSLASRAGGAFNGQTEADPAVALAATSALPLPPRRVPPALAANLAECPSQVNGQAS